MQDDGDLPSIASNETEDNEKDVASDQANPTSDEDLSSSPANRTKQVEDDDQT